VKVRDASFPGFGADQPLRHPSDPPLTGGSSPTRGPGGLGWELPMRDRICETLCFGLCRMPARISNPPQGRHRFVRPQDLFHESAQEVMQVRSSFPAEQFSLLPIPDSSFPSHNHIQPAHQFSCDGLLPGSLQQAPPLR